METTIIFSAIDYSGKPTTLELEMSCPDFKTKKNDTKEFLTKFSNLSKEMVDKLPNFPDVSINEQIIDWLDERDNTDIMYDNNLFIINDYEVKEIAGLLVSIKDNNEHEEWLRFIFEDNEEMLLNYMVVYDKMKDIVSDLPYLEQFSIVLRSMSVATTAKTSAYQHIIDIMSSGSAKEAKEKYKKEKGKNENLLGE